MRKINSILILVVISIFFSCSDDDETTQMPNPTQNGFSFNSEFFTTDELFLTGNPGELVFIIIDDTSEFNTVTREFEGDPGQVISIGVILDVDGQEDFVRTFTNAFQNGDNPDDVDIEISFVAGLIRNVQSVVPLLTGSNLVNNETILPTNTGEVTISFDSETLVFTLDYTFTTENGTVSGSHESEFITLDDSDL